MEQSGGTRNPSMAGGGDPCRDTPGTSRSSHRGTPTVHPSSLAKLEASCPRDSSRPFPKTPLPFPASPGAVWERRRGGQRGGSIFRPNYFCSQTWQSPCTLQLQHCQAQPSLLLCFLPLLPSSPGTAQHRGTAPARTPAELAALGKIQPPGKLRAPLSSTGCRERASWLREEENLMCCPGVLSAGVGEEMLTSQGDATTCINPSMGRAREGSGAG